MENAYFRVNLDFKIIPKFIHHCYRADWMNCKTYPRLWVNKTKDTPNFKHHSIAIRWLWWYWGVQKVYKEDKNEVRDKSSNINRGTDLVTSGSDEEGS